MKNEPEQTRSNAMKGQVQQNEHSEIILSSPQGVAFNFDVSIIQGLSTEQKELTFKIKGHHRSKALVKTHVYSLPNRDHSSYLDFFEKLAVDFGLRIPQNRRNDSIRPSFKASYCNVLSDNLCPEIVYGYGDPAVIRVDKERNEPWYYLLATSNDAPNSFPILRSNDLVNWKLAGFVFPEGNKPEWAADGDSISDFWAPEMHQVGNEFRVYFVARHKFTRELCIGMARSAGPEGPFVADGEPLLTGNIIDPHIFVEDSSTAYLYWKEDNNDVWPSRLINLLYKKPEFVPLLFTEKEDQITANFIVTIWPWVRTLEPMERFLAQQVMIEAVISVFANFRERLSSLPGKQPIGIQHEIRNVLKFMKTPMYAQKLSDNGSELLGERTKIIENDLDWEAHLVEGMWVSRHNNKYYLFYAGNDFSTDQYGIGVAVADTPLGPYTKMPEQLLRSSAQWWAPGHPSVVNAPDGTPTLFLHAFYPNKAGYKQFRALLSIPIKFEPNGVTLPTA